MMGKEVEFLNRIILNARGDNLYRAKCGFKGLTPELMKIQHGQSGKTRQEIIDDYQAYDDLWVKAYELFKEKILCGS